MQNVLKENNSVLTDFWQKWTMDSKFTNVPTKNVLKGDITDNSFPGIILWLAGDL